MNKPENTFQSYDIAKNISEAQKLETEQKTNLPSQSCNCKLSRRSSVIFIFYVEESPVLRNILLDRSSKKKYSIENCEKYHIKEYWNMSATCLEAEKIVNGIFRNCMGF